MADTKDLDFEELHEAVNALMDQGGGRAPRSPKSSGAPAKTDLSSEASAKDEPKEDHSIQVTVNKRPIAAVKPHGGSHGRAMDVVSPREKREVLAPPSERAKRQAPTLQPTQEVKPEPAPQVAAMPKHEPLPESSKDLDDALDTLNLDESPQPATGPTLKHQKNEFPDPLDVAAADDKPKDDKPEPTKDEAKLDKPKQDAKADEPPTVEPKEDDTPKETESGSPFVTTKVEKRPLGAYADATPKPETAKKPAADEPKSDDAKDMPNPIPAQQQPEEFNPAIVAVENAESDPSKASEPDEPDEKSDLRTMSIPQQYAESEKQADDSSRPVFDTKEYHPAIHHTQHHGTNHHSSLGAWIMAIALLVLLVGILIGAYYLITGGLDFSSLLSN